MCPAVVLVVSKPRFTLPNTGSVTASPRICVVGVLVAASDRDRVGTLRPVLRAAADFELDDSPQMKKYRCD